MNIKCIACYEQGKGRAQGRPFDERMVKGAALCVAALEAMALKEQGNQK